MRTNAKKCKCSSEESLRGYTGDIKAEKNMLIETFLKSYTNDILAHVNRNGLRIVNRNYATLFSLGWIFTHQFTEGLRNVLVTCAHRAKTYAQDTDTHLICLALLEAVGDYTESSICP